MPVYLALVCIENSLPVFLASSLLAVGSLLLSLHFLPEKEYGLSSSFTRSQILIYDVNTYSIRNLETYTNRYLVYLMQLGIRLISIEKLFKSILLDVVIST